MPYKYFRIFPEKLDNNNKKRNWRRKACFMDNPEIEHTDKIIVDSLNPCTPTTCQTQERIEAKRDNRYLYHFSYHSYLNAKKKSVFGEEMGGTCNLSSCPPKFKKMGAVSRAERLAALKYSNTYCKPDGSSDCIKNDKTRPSVIDCLSSLRRKKPTC